MPPTQRWRVARVQITVFCRIKTRVAFYRAHKLQMVRYCETLLRRLIWLLQLHMPLYHSKQVKLTQRKRVAMSRVAFYRMFSQRVAFYRWVRRVAFYLRVCSKVLRRLLRRFLSLRMVANRNRHIHNMVNLSAAMARRSVREQLGVYGLLSVLCQIILRRCASRHKVLG